MIIEFDKEVYKTEQTIYQGQISFGYHTQSTYLGSCISIILFSKEFKIGGLSHIVGHKTKIGNYNLPNEVIEQFQAYRTEYRIKDPYYFIVGGSNSCKQILEMTKKELQKNEIKYSLGDVLGKYHRKVSLIPKKSKIKIYKKRLYAFS
ncbi:MAG: hypothetical protein ACQESF_04590 [Nanobdellota archaeon]